jgi:hypothetical protein
MLVDDGELLDDVVVETVEGDDESTHARGLTEQPPLGKDILLQESVLERPDSVLLLLVVAVQGAQVEVRRILEFGVVLLVGVEEI